jgi:hypothetical protein
MNALTLTVYKTFLLLASMDFLIMVKPVTEELFLPRLAAMTERMMSGLAASPGDSCI